MKHAFTIDLEDWYQGIELDFSQWKGKEYRLEKGLEVILRLLDETSTKSTFFILGWLGEQYPSVVKSLAAQGHEIASHGYNHEKVYKLSRAQFREDIRKTKGILEDLGGIAVTGYRAPFFSVTSRSLWALEILKEEGFAYDCSISPIVTWRYGISATPAEMFRIAELDLLEFPVSPLRLFGKKIGVGGAYFRIFPYFLFRNFFSAKDLEQKAAMFYAHPWEYDPDHPVVSMDRRAKLTHYFNLGTMVRKSRELLRSYTFSTASEVITDASRAGTLPVVSLSQLA